MLKSRVLCVFRERLKKLRVAHHPALFFDPWLEGYRSYTFGGRSGPSVAVGAMFHELAHASQLGARRFRFRATEAGFRFKVPTRFVFDRYCDEPLTHQATLRELDTFAHQLHLMRAAGCRVRDDAYWQECAHVMRLMHDWLNVPGEGDHGRALHCIQRMQDFHASITTAEVLDRLEGWLDATSRRLAKDQHDCTKLSDCFRPVSRHRVDGTLWMSGQ